MLFGTIETLAERVEHLLRLRDLQAETGGFLAFIPLPFHPENNALGDRPAPTAAESLRTVAVARLLLDNVPHLKAYWVSLGARHGADRAVVRRRRLRRHGQRGEDLPRGRRALAAAPSRRGEIARLIRAAGRVPVERDTFYRPVSLAAARGGVSVRRLRLAAVSFLNTRPITYGIERGLVGRGSLRARASTCPRVARRRC